MTLTVLYTCKACGFTDRKVEVPTRGSGQPLRDWMGIVQAALGIDHRRTSPDCRSSVCDLKIPMPPGAELIGGPVVQ